MFRDSANELKSPRCLATTGILSALYIVLNAYVMLPLGETLRITFGYLALAVIGMLYGPVVTVLAAIPCDIFAALLNPNYAMNLAWVPNRMLEGLIYGVFLYGLMKTSNKNSTLNAIVFALKIIIARLIVVVLCYFIINSFLTLIVFSPASAAGQSFWVWAWVRSGVKSISQFPIDMILLFALLPIINTAYHRALRGFGRERKNT